MKKHTNKIFWLPLVAISLASMVCTASWAKDDDIWFEDNSKSRITSMHDMQNIELKLGKGTLLSYDGDPTTLFIADANVADFEIKKAGLIYFLPKKIGQTNLIGLDANHHVLFRKTIRVNYDLSQIRDKLHLVVKKAYITVDALGESILLRGTVENPEQAERVMKLVHTFLGDVKIMNHLKISQQTQISLHVHIVELSRDMSKALGIDWSAIGKTGSFLFGGAFINGVGTAALGVNSLGETLDSISFGGSTASTTNLRQGFHLDAIVTALERNGLISILAEPNLTTLSGTSGSFLAGGEFPVVVASNEGNFTSNVEFKSFGVGLTFTPKLIEGNLIRLHVNQEVSSLSNTGSVTIDSISYPGLSTRRADVTAVLHSGQSMAIAGLLQKDMSMIVQKYPWFADLPVLGKLFRSKNFLNNQSELVIVVTPYLVKPVNRLGIALPTDHIDAREPGMLDPRSTNPKAYGFIK